MCMTRRSAIRCFWAMRAHFTLNQPIAPGKPGINLPVLGSKTGCNAKDTATVRCLKPTKHATRKSPLHAPGEKDPSQLATYKRLYGLARTRFMGLKKNMNFYGIAAIAQNIQKGAKFLAL